MQGVWKRKGVDRIVAGQCQYGQRSAKGLPVKKPTGLLTNSPLLLRQLSERCTGSGGYCSPGGNYATCSGGTAKNAAIYPNQLCEAILRGIRAQLQHDGHHAAGGVGLIDANCRGLEEILSTGGESNSLASGIYKGDLSGQVLVDELVEDARRLGLEHFKDKRVWELKGRVECFSVAGKPPVTVRWVDANKGDDVTPNYRPRLVARQIRH